MTKKIIFWVDGNPFTFILANSIQKKFDCELYAIIDITDKPKKFFLEQKFVNFKKVWFFHDHIHPKKSVSIDFLKSFEMKYGLNLWQLAQNERLFNFYNKYYDFSTSEILSILDGECRLYKQIFEEIHPDFFITKETALHHQHLFYELCKKNNTKVLMLNQSKFGYKCIISQELHKLDFVDSFDSVNSSNRTLSELQDYLKSFNMSKQLIDHKNSFLASKKEKFKAAIDYLLFSNNSNIKNNFAYYGRSKLRVLIKEIVFSSKKWYRGKFINSNLQKTIPKNRNFIYFTLHQEPERTLLIGSPYYTNQLETINHISKSLPIGYTLIVKEHPTQSIRGWHEINFYKKVLKLPNVIFLHPSVSSEKLLQKCSIVISVNGTTGFEAVFYGKPSIVFTDLGYSILPSVFVLKNISELHLIIQKALKTKISSDDLDKYVNLLENHSFDFDYFKFITDYQNYFYFGGHLIDVEIPILKMQKFIEEKESLFDKLSDEYIKKMNFLDYNS